MILTSVCLHILLRTGQAHQRLPQVLETRVLDRNDVTDITHKHTDCGKYVGYQIGLGVLIAMWCKPSLQTLDGRLWENSWRLNAVRGPVRFSISQSLFAKAIFQVQGNSSHILNKQIIVCAQWWTYSGRVLWEGLKQVLINIFETVWKVNTQINVYRSLRKCVFILRV